MSVTVPWTVHPSPFVHCVCGQGSPSVSLGGSWSELAGRVGAGRSPCLLRTSWAGSCRRAPRARGGCVRGRWACAFGPGRARAHPTGFPSARRSEGGFRGAWRCARPGSRRVGRAGRREGPPAGRRRVQERVPVPLPARSADLGELLVQQTPRAVGRGAHVGFRWPRLSFDGLVGGLRRPICGLVHPCPLFSTGVGCPHGSAHRPSAPARFRSGRVCHYCVVVASTPATPRRHLWRRTPVSPDVVSSKD